MPAFISEVMRARMGPRPETSSFSAGAVVPMPMLTELQLLPAVQLLTPRMGPRMREWLCVAAADGKRKGVGHQNGESGDHADEIEVVVSSLSDNP